MDEKTKVQILDLIHREVIPAIGCTEPIAVALASAKAAEILNKEVEQVDVLLSANILKNAMGVGIPGTGMVGLPIAIALGALIGKSDYGLEVLRDLTPSALEKGRRMVEGQRIHVGLKEQVGKLYIEVVCRNGEESATAIIAHEHTHFVYLAHNNEVLKDERRQICKEGEEGERGRKGRGGFRQELQN